MLLAPSQRDKPLRHTLGDSVSEVEHSLKGLNFSDHASSEAGNGTYKSVKLPPRCCQPAKPAASKVWQAHLKAAVPVDQRLPIAYDKVQNKTSGLATEPG
jgi:hypothetical protein